MKLGPVGDLRVIRDPARGMGASPGRQRTELVSPDGYTTIQKRGRGRRAYELYWTWLDSATLSYLEELYEGLGPYVLIDPARTNMLAANQATGTETERNTDGFLASDGAISSTATHSYNASRSLLWVQDASPAAGAYVSLTWPGAAAGFPVTEYEDYAFSARLSTSSASFELCLGLAWSDIDGVDISTTTWDTISGSGDLDDYMYHSVAGEAPAGAVYAEPRIIAATNVATGTVSADAMQLQEASTASDWRMGTGTPQVSILDVSDSYPLYGMHDVTLTLREAG